MPFCHSCGKPVPDGAKFCNNCGTTLVQAATPIAGAAGGISGTEVLSEATEKPKYDIHELGKSLEMMTQEILKHMNYRTETRQHLEDKSGSKHEIDVLATRGQRVLPVECKNFGENYAVGIEHLRNFRQKLTDLKIPQGLFVTNVRFSSDAENFAQSHGISLWNGEELRERFFSMTIGRLPKEEGAMFELALPSLVDYPTATAVPIANTGSVKVSQAQLVFYPYYKVQYKLKAVRLDPVKDKHVVEDEATYVIDGLDGEILNPEESAASKVISLFKKSEEKAERKMDKLITQDLIDLTPEENMQVTQTTDYGVSKIKPEVREKTVLRTIVERVISRNVKEESYEVRVGKEKKTEKRKISIIPKADEVAIKRVSLIHVPLWDVEFESGQQTYSRRILSSSRQTVKDEIAFCPKHFQMGGLQLVKKQTTAVCEICGQALCEDHIILAPDGIHYCEEHLPDQYKPKEPEKKQPFGFKLPFGR